MALRRWGHFQWTAGGWRPLGIFPGHLGIGASRSGDRAFNHHFSLRTKPRLAESPAGPRAGASRSSRNFAEADPGANLFGDARGVPPPRLGCSAAVFCPTHVCRLESGTPERPARGDLSQLRSYRHHLHHAPGRNIHFRLFSTPGY